MRASIGTALLFFGLVLSIAAPAHSRTWLVYEDGSGDAASIQAAIDSASAGDSVLVGPGTYPGLLSYRGKDVVLKSLQGPEATILDGQQQGSVITFAGGETRAAVLEGFTITNGSGNRVAGFLKGGAVFCSEGSPTVRWNIIADNSANFGGGIFAGLTTSDGSNLPDPVIVNNTLRGNLAQHVGGAIALVSSRATIRDNDFSDNISILGDGGAVYVSLRAGKGSLLGNTFTENRAGDKGGAVFVYTSTLRQAGPVDLHRNVFARNSASGADVGDVGSGGAVFASDMIGSIRWNTLVGNSGFGETSCSGGGIGLLRTTADLTISDNVIVGSHGCGIACRQQGTAAFGQNLFWENDPKDVADAPEPCPSESMEMAVLANPLFCVPGTGDYRVAANSPALTGPEPMGAFHEPGCTDVAVRPTTWGILKARY